MKQPIRVLLASAVTVLLLVSCGGEQAIPALDTGPRPVKTLLISGPDDASTRQFPGRVVAAQRSTLSFRIGGKVSRLLVNEGEDVAAGQTIASLDENDLRIALRERDAAHKQAEADFRRAEELVEQGHVSRREYDRLEAALAATKAALDQARRNLGYATLKAPFAGSITRRLVNGFEQVMANQPVLELNNLSNLEIKFDVPETLVQRIRHRTPEEARAVTEGRVTASFDSLPGRQFALTFKEASTEADPDTRTFEASFVMPPSEDVHILPGMSATVTANLAGIIENEVPRILVPAHAVVANSDLQAQVWVVEPETMTLKQRPVSVGVMRGTKLEILDGLQAGDRIVVAGVPYLVADTKVTLMAQTEQAESRPAERH